MEIRQLKYFVEIATTGSFSEASRTFFLSQSAISQQIKALETEIGSALFTRTSHKVKLTESGETLLPLAREIIHNMDECQKRMADIKGMLSGELKIGLTPTMEQYLRVTMIKFMKLHPHVQLHIYYKSIPELIHLLRNNQIDLAFSILSKGEDDWVESTPMVSYNIRAVMRDTHPLASRKMLTFKDLEHQNTILPEMGFKECNSVEYYLSRYGARLNVRATVNEKHAILNILKRTNYISILTEQSIRDTEHLKAIPIYELSKPVINYAHLLKGIYHKKSALVFLELMKETIKEPYSSL